uniref:ADAM cysteine-rich domain-containing protein n=1 Tax=Coturnix japonica TaxID=93934 RepID=A0A8C2T486_COTJA
MWARPATPTGAAPSWRTTGCSRRSLLHMSWVSRCLLDRPIEWLQLPSALPGAVYPADRQCQLAFGPDSRHCGDVQPPCAALWCSGIAGGRAVCQTKHFPWADGTPCAAGRVCASGQCVVLVELMVPVDGSWSPWSPWSRCSRSCGGGVSSSQRFCSRPTPRNGGRFCRGERLRFRSCNINKCPGGSGEFDKCRRCGGDGTGCVRVRGSFRAAAGVPAMYPSLECSDWGGTGRPPHPLSGGVYGGKWEGIWGMWGKIRGQMGGGKGGGRSSGSVWTGPSMGFRIGENYLGPQII